MKKQSCVARVSFAASENSYLDDLGEITLDHAAPDEYSRTAQNQRYDGNATSDGQIRDYPSDLLGEQVDGQVDVEKEDSDVFDKTERSPRWSGRVRGTLTLSRDAVMTAREEVLSYEDPMERGECEQWKAAMKENLGFIESSNI